MDEEDWDLHIVLSDEFDRYGPRRGVRMNSAASWLLPDVQEIEAPTIRIDWPDFETPGLDRAWWVSLVEALQNLPPKTNDKGEPYRQSVGIYCQGGHGRTGTALSIILDLAGLNENNDDPVQFMRDNYCDNAVENEAQLEYISDILEKPVSAKAARPLWVPQLPTYAHNTTTHSAKEAAMVFGGGADLDEDLGIDDAGNHYYWDHQTGRVIMIPPAKL